MANRAWTFEECKNHFNEQEQRIREKADGASYAHCIDRESFGGSCYDPTKVVTSNGRVWSLRSGDFLDEEALTNIHGYYRVAVSASASDYNHSQYMTIHKLVANYFCDKSLFDVMRKVNEREGENIFDLGIDMYGNYNDVTIHHMDHDKLNNRADNLQYIYDKLHDAITALHNRNNNNLSQLSVVRYQNILRTFNLDITDPEFKTEDRTILDIINNADQPGIKIFGYVNPGKVAGYRIEIGVKGNVQGHMTEEEKLEFLDEKFPEAPLVRQLIGKTKEGQQ